ncbi:MAG: radical SAM protein [Acidobacteriota bacterium]|nr:radical SAM protein [Acidobacteriota bacterium]
MSESNKTTFGPVPSRRLGRSLGINNIPPKVCSYACVYCQVGRTLRMEVKRKEFYDPEIILRDTEEKIRDAAKRQEPIDYLSFVPDGEPTLDVHLGREIKELKKFGIKIAVITNSSLLWREDVRNELSEADWVSVKVDAATPDVWRKVNRPHGSLELDKILRGISQFARVFKGDLATETMLIHQINDHAEEIGGISDFISTIAPKKSYLSIPTRPPAESRIGPPAESVLNRAYQIFIDKGIPTECLIGYEGNAFAFTGDVNEDLLSITAVHPMRDDAVRELLSKAGAGWEVIERLIEDKKLIEVNYENRIFYIRKMVRDAQKESV